MVFHRRMYLLFICITLILSACAGGFGLKATETPLPTPTAIPPMAITICSGKEPQSLYLYGSNSQAARDVLAAIYDGPIDIIDNQPQPVILQKLPAFQDGDAYFNPLGVEPGDEIIDADGNLVTLAEGVELFPRDCRSQECIITYDGQSPLQMDALVVTYTLLAGIQWSDGTPLTAADAVYSFQLAADADTPTLKRYTDQVASYQAIDELTVQMVSKPGLVPRELHKYFWTPLPQHAWGQYSAAELLAAEVSVRKPIGWGPYMIEEWIPGESIHLAKNPFYFRANEGLPEIDLIQIRYLPASKNLQTIVDDAICDVINYSLVAVKDYSIVKEIESDQYINVYYEDSQAWETMFFGINPSSYDDGYYPYGSDRQDIFGDARTRQAISLCIDREAIIQDFLHGYGAIPKAFLSSSYQFFSLTQAIENYDPQAVNALLIAVGWKDFDANPDTPRISIAVNNVVDGTLLVLNYHIPVSEFRRSIAENIRTMLAQCGVQMNIIELSAEEFYAPGPEGVVFGRKFDLAQFSWNINEEMPCQLFEGEEVPSLDNYWIGNDDGGGNISGYKDDEYDSFCKAANRSGVNTEMQQTNEINLINKLMQDKPIIPLFYYPQFFIKKSNLCTVKNTQDSFPQLDLIEKWTVADVCN